MRDEGFFREAIHVRNRQCASCDRRTVFRDAAGGIATDNGGIIDRVDGDCHRRRCCAVRLAVVGDVGEAVGAVEIGVRRVGEAAVSVQHQRAVGDIA